MFRINGNVKLRKINSKTVLSKRIKSTENSTLNWPNLFKIFKILRFHPDGVLVTFSKVYVSMNRGISRSTGFQIKNDKCR